MPRIVHMIHTFSCFIGVYDCLVLTISCRVTSLALRWSYPDNKVYGAYMGPTWGRQDPGESHVGPMIPAICDLWLCVSEAPLGEYGKIN